jgi:hypothetical protein
MTKESIFKPPDPDTSVERKDIFGRRAQQGDVESRPMTDDELQIAYGGMSIEDAAKMRAEEERVKRTGDESSPIPEPSEYEQAVLRAFEFLDRVYFGPIDEES